MPYEPQAQKPQAQNNPSSNQTPDKTGQVAAGNVKKDEPTDRMKDEGGNCSTSSDKKSTQGGCN